MTDDREQTLLAEIKYLKSKIVELEYMYACPKCGCTTFKSNFDWEIHDITGELMITSVECRGSDTLESCGWIGNVVDLSKVKRPSQLY